MNKNESIIPGNPKKRVKIFDTTLRDGEQSPGFTMNEKNKIELAKMMLGAGVDVIEAGFPIASNGDFMSVKNIADSVGQSRKVTICGLARATEGDIIRAGEAVRGAIRSRIHTFIGTTDLRLAKQYANSKNPEGITREEAVSRVRRAVKMACDYAYEVEFSAEDATRTDLEFLKRVYGAAIEEGAKIINVPDTVGEDSFVFDPEKEIYVLKYGSLIRELRDFFGDDIVISTHCHNDRGLATANTVAGVLNGARQVHVTINGIGERAGNASMEEVIDNLDKTGVSSAFNKKYVRIMSQTLTRITNITPQPNKPIVGANAFAHESGIHQDGYLKDRDIYEVVHPEDYGFDHVDSLILGKHSGQAAVVEKLKHIGISLTPEMVKKLSEEVKEWADRNPRKKGLTTEELQKMIALNPEYRIQGMFEFVNHRIEKNNGNLEARVTMKIRDREVSGEAKGDGPIEAGILAIKGIMKGFDYEMRNFEVHSSGQGEDADALVSMEVACIAPGYGALQIAYSVKAFGSSSDTVRAALMCFVNGVNQIEYQSRGIGK